MSHKIEATGTGATSQVKLGLGTWIISLHCGGSTVEIQAKAYGESDAQFITQTLPDGTSTDTATDMTVECKGGLIYRFNVTAYVDDVEGTFSSAGD